MRIDRRINLKIFLGYDFNYLSIWPFMGHPWFPTRKASKLTFACFQLAGWWPCDCFQLAGWCHSHIAIVRPPGRKTLCRSLGTNSLVLLQKICKNCPHPEKLHSPASWKQTNISLLVILIVRISIYLIVFPQTSKCIFYSFQKWSTGNECDVLIHNGAKYCINGYKKSFSSM